MKPLRLRADLPIEKIMRIDELMARLPDTAKGALVVLSGGLDSTTAMRLAVEKYGVEHVTALSFFYGQRQSAELYHATASAQRLCVHHKIIDISFLGEINQGFSANVDGGMTMPVMADVVGDPAPATYVANRNMVMFSIAAAVAEVRGIDLIICGLQSNDNYNYHDTTPQWLSKLNALLAENRKNHVEVVAPFVDLSKTDEIRAVLELDNGSLALFANTMTCYNPQGSLSCGVCPSCAERQAAFAAVGVRDPILYVGV